MEVSEEIAPIDTEWKNNALCMAEVHLFIPPRLDGVQIYLFLQKDSSARKFCFPPCYWQSKPVLPAWWSPPKRAYVSADKRQEGAGIALRVLKVLSILGGKKGEER